MGSILISNFDSRFPNLSFHRENFAPTPFKGARKRGEKLKMCFFFLFKLVLCSLSFTSFVLKEEGRKVREDKTSVKSGSAVCNRRSPCPSFLSKNNLTNSIRRGSLQAEEQMVESSSCDYLFSNLL